MDRTRERRWDRDSTALILLLNCHDTDGNQKFSILILTHTFSLHNPSLGAEVPGSARSFTHLSVSSGFPSGADAAFSKLVLTVLCQLKMNKCPVPVPGGQVCLGLWCSWSSGLGKGSGSAGARLARDSAHVSSLALLLWEQLAGMRRLRPLISSQILPRALS